MRLQLIYTDFDKIQKVYDKLSYQRVFDLMKSFKELKEQVEEIEKKRQEIAKKYSDDNGKILQDKQEEANKEFQELLNTEVELGEGLKFTRQDIENSNVLTGGEVFQLAEDGIIAENE